MDNEEREFSWTDLFIKVIVILIIILFAVWLLSLANRRMTNSLEVMTNNIFSENINKMKDIGKDYFVAGRLPENVGDEEKITLEEMYKNKMLLTVKDSEGNACSSKNSYVSILKLDNGYEMKVYLECGEKQDYIVTPISCNSYCTADECKNNNSSSNSNSSKNNTNNLEYEYVKRSGGSWSNWSNYSDWSTKSVIKNDNTDVETKIVKENYTYDKIVNKNEYMGYSTCEVLSGYTLVSNENGVCNYSKIDVITDKPICPEVSGYVNTSRTGFTCSYSKTTNDYKNPYCPELTEYVNTGRNGFDCSYSKTTNDYKDPYCPSLTGYSNTGRSGFTCNYSKTVTSDTEYTLSYYGSGSGSHVPKDTKEFHYVLKSADYIYNCDGSCGMKWYYVYIIYKKVYKTNTVTTTGDAKCPSGYNKSGNTCVKSTTTNKTGKASCPSGYTPSGTTCVKTASNTITKEAKCLDGYYKSGSLCAKNNVTKTTRDASCPKDQKISNGWCYKNVSSVIQVNDTKDVTYYRYRTRDYVGGTIDYKWSTSNNDKSLLNSGYKLTGKTRNLKIGGK